MLLRGLIAVRPAALLLQLIAMVLGQAIVFPGAALIISQVLTHTGPEERRRIYQPTYFGARKVVLCLLLQGSVQRGVQTLVANLVWLATALHHQAQGGIKFMPRVTNP